MFPADLSHRLALVSQGVGWEDREAWTKAVARLEDSGVTQWADVPQWIKDGKGKDE